MDTYDSKEDELFGADELEKLNRNKPLWMRNSDQITKGIYAILYKFVSNDCEDHLRAHHFSVEGQMSRCAPNHVFASPKTRSNIQLYVRRFFFMADCDKLIPTWFRSFTGVVDFADSPLHISQGMIHQSKIMRVIKRAIVERCLLCIP